MEDTENENSKEETHKSSFERIIDAFSGNIFNIFSLLFSKIMLFSEKSVLSFMNSVRKRLISDIEEILSILILKNFMIIVGFSFLFVGFILFLAKYITLDFVFLIIGIFCVLISVFINPKKTKNKI